MVKQKNKKGMNTTTALVSILVSLLSFLLLGNVLFEDVEFVATEAQNIACKNLISSKSNTALKMYDFFFELRTKCRVNDYTIEGEESEDILSKLADETQVCWEKYGAGEYDFMSNYDTSGNWCFLCAKLDFEQQDKIYRFQEFIDEVGKIEVEVDGDTIPYLDYVQMKYIREGESFEKDSELLKTISEELKILAEGEGSEKGIQELEPMVAYFLDQYSYYRDLKLKKIDTNENIYVVYRYDRIDNSFTEALSNAALGTATGAAAGATAGIAVKLVVGLVIGGPIGVGVAILDGLKKVYDASETAKKFFQAREKIIKGVEIVQHSVEVSGKGRALVTAVRKLDTSVDGIKHLADTEGLKFLKDLHKLMVDKKVANLDELGGVLTSEERVQMISEWQENADKLRGYTKKSEKLGGTQIKALEDLREAEKKVDLVDNFEGTEAKAKAVIDYYKTAIKLVTPIVIATTTGAVAGGVIGSNMNFNEMQYVDLMTKEQYYRYCGTEPPIESQDD